MTGVAVRGDAGAALCHSRRHRCPSPSVVWVSLSLKQRVRYVRFRLRVARLAFAREALGVPRPCQECGSTDATAMAATVRLSGLAFVFRVRPGVSAPGAVSVCKGCFWAKVVYDAHRYGYDVHTHHSPSQPCLRTASRASTVGRSRFSCSTLTHTIRTRSTGSAKPGTVYRDPAPSLSTAREPAPSTTSAFASCSTSPSPRLRRSRSFCGTAASSRPRTCPSGRHRT